MKRVVPREFGTTQMSNKMNEELTPAGDSVGTITASGAIPITASRLFRINANSLALTVAAPATNGTTEGVELTIAMLAGVAATVTVTGMDVSATADVFTLAAASATSRPVLTLKCFNVGTKASPSYKWLSGPLGAGVTVA